MSGPPPIAAEPPDDQRVRLGWFVLFVGVAVFSAKLVAWRLTGSTAVLSDALESVVNVAAGVFLLISMKVASQEADHDHPYGHGKIEFFSAGFEGALIGVAAIWIAVEAIVRLVVGGELQRLDTGLVLVTLASVANGGLGLYLVRVGRRLHSPALEADGRHLLTDVITSVGTVTALALVWITGWTWIDPVIALFVGVHILRTGWSLVRSAVRGLMDEADPAVLETLVEALNERREDAWIDSHGLRARRSGATQYVDLHVVVPRYYDADQLHRIDQVIERSLLNRIGRDGESIVHFDPCRERHCPECAVLDCPVRSAEFRARREWTVESVTRGDEALDTGRPLRTGAATPRPADSPGA